MWQVWMQVYTALCDMQIKNEPISSESLNKLSGKVKSNKKAGILEH